MKKYMITLLMALAFGTAAWAQSDLQSVPLIDNVTGQVVADITPDHGGGGNGFLGCTHDNHECHDRAHQYGYQYSYTVHDHRTCGPHESFACYGYGSGGWGNR